MILQIEYPVDLTSDGQQIVIILLFTILVLCVGLIGWFMKKSAEHQKEAIISQKEAVVGLGNYTDQIKQSVEELTIAVNSLQEFNKIYLPKMNERLDKHGDFMKHIDKRLTQLETEHKLLSCRTKSITNRRKSKQNEKT